MTATVRSSSSAGYRPSTESHFEVRREGVETDTVFVGLQPRFLDIEAGEMPLYPLPLKAQQIEGVVHFDLSENSVTVLDGRASSTPFGD